MGEGGKEGGRRKKEGGGDRGEEGEEGIYFRDTGYSSKSFPQ